MKNKKKQIYRVRETNFDESDLNPTTESLLNDLKEYIERSEIPSEECLIIDVSSTKRLVDLSNRKSQIIWRDINRFLLSTKEKKEIIFQLLQSVGVRAHQWKRIDQRKDAEQLQTIKEIGKLADKLRTILVTSSKGQVTEFLSWWSQTESKKILPIEAFVPGENGVNLMGHFAWVYQRSIVHTDQKAPAELLIRLTSLSNASKQFPNLKKEVNKVGLKSQKRNQFTFFVISLHISLKEIFGRSMHVLNANLTSLVFNEPVSKDRIKEIIERAQERGEILGPKSK